MPISRLKARSSSSKKLSFSFSDGHLHSRIRFAGKTSSTSKSGAGKDVPPRLWPQRRTSTTTTDTAAKTASVIEADEANFDTDTTGKCPFKHGTVYARPYPGYVHGNPKKGVCPNGCRPQMNCDITEYETPKETLIREAIEYLELYYHERYDEMKGTTGFMPKEERINSVRNSIETSGTYAHTFDELQHGARVAWRNAPKCSNRKYWQNLKLLDCRDVTSNKGIYDCCLDHLSKAMSCGSSEAYISVFRQAAQGTSDGPRIWNDQLLQYAAYMDDDGNVMGDPKNLRFTQMLQERFGWKGPKSGEQGSYDYLPLVVQADPQDEPELFDMPVECVPHVHIHHPKYPDLSLLDLRWYPIPAVCALDLTLGGILYTAVPFNGWYADTEVLRDLIDEDRYDLLVPIAQALGIYEETKPGEAPYYKDEVILILSKAINYSFKTAKVAMIDHHNLIDMFWDWYKSEMLSRKYCPVNWKWVIPPVAASTNSAYLGLSKAQEYTLKPAYILGKGFVELENATFGKRSLDSAYKSLFLTARLLVFLKRWVRDFRERKQPVVIVYASVTGNAAKHAGELAHILRQCSNITFFDACSANAALDEDILHHIGAASLVIFVSSTQGNGEIPSLSKKFFSLLFSDENRYLLADKKAAVLAFGSSAYPMFCNAGLLISDMLKKCGATEIVPRANCDAVKGEATTFFNWTCKLVEAWADLNPTMLLVHQLMDKMKSKKEAILMQVEELLKTIDFEIIREDEINEAALSSVKQGRQSLSVSNHGGRRLLDGIHVPLRQKSTVDLSLSLHGRPSLLDGLDSTFESSTKDSSPVLSASSAMSRDDIIQGILIDKLSGGNSDNATYEGEVISREEMIKTDSGDGRSTSLIKIDLDASGTPPYQPGDHARIYPRNKVKENKMKFFVKQLSGDLGLDDQIYAWNRSETDQNLEQISVASPLLYGIIGSLTRVRDLLEKEMAVHAPMSMHACLQLSKLATNEADATILQTLGSNEAEYAAEISSSGLKWISMFDRFRSLSQQVDITFLLCYAKKNHVRSYSIASCKDVVGSEVHLVVGRYLYNLGKTQQVGVCSNYLTSSEPGDYVSFKLESTRSFHLPSNPACPTIFICTGTGFAPMRGLLQKRQYFRSRGEKLGPAYLIFGTRSSEEGFFHDEVKAFEEIGVLTSVFLCYSREPGKKKEYTTDKLRDEVVKATIGPVIAQPNSHVFICGSANMAEESKSALKDISSESCIDKLVEEGRLHCDVFGAVNTSNKQ